MTHICSKQDIFAPIANEIWNSAHANAPFILYHYCTVEAVLSIGKSRKMWSSAFECMNDEGEFRLGFKMAEREIQNSIDQLNISHKSIIKTKWATFLQAEIQNPTLRPYVLSFSSEPSNAHLWEAYADQSKGVALKIALVKKQISASKSLVLKMSYDINLKRAELNLYLRQLEANFNSHTCQSCLEGNLSNLFNSYLQTIFFCSISVKDQKWSQEKEWRLVSFASPNMTPQSYWGDIKYRTRDGKVVDFLEVDLFRTGLNLEAFVIGREASKNGITLFAKQHGYSII